jgi:hypothetical protein
VAPSRLRPFALVVTGGVLACAGSAVASDPAAAQALFAEARRKMQEGDYAQACPMLEESERVDPAVGTLYHLADCNEHLGKTATAWALFLEVVEQTHANGQVAREKEARSRALALAGKLSRIVLVVPGRRFDGLEVRRDGTLVAPAQWGAALPVDPGKHAFAATAPGRTPWHGTVDVAADGATTTVSVPDLAEAGGASAPREETDPRPDDSIAPRADVTTTSPQRLAAEVLAGAGAVGIGVGAAFGIVAWVKHGQSNGGCDQANVCTAAAGAARDDAIRAGNVSTAAFGIGLALAAGGVVLWVTEPRPAAASAAREGAELGIAPWPSGVALLGTFH